MAPPPVTIYVTSLTSQPKVRQSIDLLHRALKGLEIPYETFDLVVDEQAKTRWRRAKPPGTVVGLPGYLVGGEWVGTMDDFEHAVETATLPKFLKQDQDYDIDSINASSGGAGSTSGTVAEAELEKLMREMSDGDLDKLAGDIGAGDGLGKVGLMAAPAIPTAPASKSSVSASTKPSAGEVRSPTSGGGGGSGQGGQGSGGMAKSVGVEKTKSRASMEDKAEVARQMMEAGTVDGLLAAMDKAEGKEKLD